MYLQQLQHYRDTSSPLLEWIGATRKKQDGLQGAKIDDIGGLNEYLGQQKVTRERPVEMDRCSLFVHKGQFLFAYVPTMRTGKTGRKTQTY